MLKDQLTETYLFLRKIFKLVIKFYFNVTSVILNLVVTYLLRIIFSCSFANLQIKLTFFL